MKSEKLKVIKKQKLISRIKGIIKITQNAIHQKINFKPQTTNLKPHFCIFASNNFDMSKKGKVLILIFIVIKIFFDNWIDYKKLLFEKDVEQ